MFFGDFLVILDKLCKAKVEFHLAADIDFAGSNIFPRFGVHRIQECRRKANVLISSCYSTSHYKQRNVQCQL